MAWNYTYDELLKKARKQLPDIIIKSERFEMPRVAGGYQGNRTWINNFNQIAVYLRREPEHLLKYLAGELATQARIEGVRAEFTGRFTSDEINKKIINYVNDFVTCKECNNHDTKIIKEDRLTILKCLACGSNKSIRSIK